jgi:hypothetical protein
MGHVSLPFTAKSEHHRGDFSGTFTAEFLSNIGKTTNKTNFGRETQDQLRLSGMWKSLSQVARKVPLLRELEQLCGGGDRSCIEDRRSII